MKNLSRILGVGGILFTSVAHASSHNAPNPPKGPHIMREATAFTLRVVGHMFIATGFIFTATGKKVYKLASKIRRD